MTEPDPASEFVDRVCDAIARHDLLPRAPSAERQPCVVGVSGGPDSVALVRVLAHLAGEGRLAIAPVLAHLHHGLRAESADADQVFVEHLAAALDLPLETRRADVPAEAQAEGVGVEEAGREARRRFFIETARARGARKVALGHHGGDRIETVLFHILRGTGIDGLAALGPRAALAPEAGIAIVRPLMHPAIGREEVLAYLRHIGQPWREDETNRDPAQARNRLRHEVLPMLARAVNPAVGDALFRLADQAGAARAVLDDALERVWRQVVREAPEPSEPDAEASGHVPGPRPVPRAMVIDADDFGPLRPWLQGAILRRAIERLGGGLKHMSAARTHEVVAALLSKPVAGPVDLPGGLVAERRRRAIRIGHPADEDTP